MTCGKPTGAGTKCNLPAGHGGQWHEWSVERHRALGLLAAWRDRMAADDPFAPPIEIRIKPDSGHSWTAEGWRGGEQRYIRAWNRSPDEAWQYGAEWMRGEMMKNATETK